VTFNFYELDQKMRNISYTAVVIDHASRTKLLETLGVGTGLEAAGWEIIAHHMTINMGDASKGPAADMVGEQVHLSAKTLAEDDKVMAVGVSTDVPSTNDIKHITIAVHRGNGGKPFHSNRLQNWRSIPTIHLTGIVTEVPR